MTGSQHSKINLASSISLVAVEIYFFSSVTVSIGILFSILVSPDLDLESYIGLYYFRRTFGEAGSKYWQYLWRPYAINFAHRGISHMPIVGTLIRFIYIVLPTSMYLLPREYDKSSIIAIIYSQLLALPFTGIFVITIVAYPLQVLLFVLGIVIGDMLHIVCDILSSGYKRKRKEVIKNISNRRNQIN